MGINNTSKLITAFLFCMLLTQLSCKKEDPYKSMTTAEKLTSCRWQVDDVQVGVRVSVADNCDLDNIITLNTDSTCLFDRGNNLCDSLEPRFYNGTWALTENDKKINLMGYTYEIAVLQKEYFRIWLRDYVTNNNDTLDIYFMFKSIPR